jgi:hypothetical protein
MHSQLKGRSRLSYLFPIGARIKNIAGVLEQRDSWAPYAMHYLAIIELDNGTVAYLGENGIARLYDIPDDIADLPAQVLDGDGDLTGCVITNVFICHRPDDSSGTNGSQLFVVLNNERLMGIMPTHRGALLHVEALVTSPLIRPDDKLLTITNKPVSIGELVGT